MGERYMLRRVWEKWAPPVVGPSGKPLTGAALLNLASDPPFRFYSLVMEQEGLSLNAADVRPIVESLQEKCLHLDYFIMGSNRYIITSIHEHMYHGRSLTSGNSNGSGAIIACSPYNAIIATYDGSIGAASKAMATVETFYDHLTQSFS